MGWPKWGRWSLGRGGALKPDEYRRQRDALIRRARPPVFWLFGKAGSGKSSIIQLLTGADRIQIGHGFRPTTTATCRYDFPDPEFPLLVFLDTRGVGEVGYDPTDDFDEATQQAGAIIVAHRALDFAVESVTRPLKQIREQARRRPIILALTCLHEAYPQQQHPPYPFTKHGPFGRLERSADDGAGPPICPQLARSMDEQSSHFAGLVDCAVAVDLTQPEDGFDDPNYGAAQLTDALMQFLPAAYGQALRNAADLVVELRDLDERVAMPTIEGAAQLAAAAALSPVPWIDMPIVTALQTRMVHSIAGIYGQSSSVQQVLEFLTTAGVGFAARLGTRELLKLIPYFGTLAGGFLGAALAYSYTYAIGRAACWYYARVRDGHEPSPAELKRVFRDRWQEGRRTWQQRGGPGR